MASGVPVISSNSGGIPEVNIDGFSGYLSPVGDVGDMSRNAISILKDPKVLNQFKKQARQQAEKFNIHNIVPKYEAIYENTLSNCMQLK